MTFRSAVAEPIEQTIVGEKREDRSYIPVEATVRLLLECDSTDTDLIDGSWEPEMREAVANTLVGVKVPRLTVASVAVTRLRGTEY